MRVHGVRQPWIRFGWGLLILLMIFTSPFGIVHSQSNKVTLSIQPITWDVVGLDSNNVNAGPNQFLVGARVCNRDRINAATNVVSNFIWDNTNAYINLVDGSYLSLTVASLAPETCADLYYNVAITRNAAAYNNARQYHITAQAENATQVATPAGRQIFVEHLVSQNRNSIASITCPTSNPPAGTSACLGSVGNYTMLVGQTYEFTFVHNTATQGYEQIESFVNFPNLLYQIVSVSSTYSEPTSYTSDMIYQDACGWDPIARSCVGPVPIAFSPRGTAGGSITSRYRVKVVGAGLATVSGVIYDFSGSSFHYNSDFGTTAGSVTLTAVKPPDLSLTKSDGGASAAPGETVAYALNYSNSGGAAAGVTLTETVPANAAYNAGASTTGWACTPNNNAGSTCTLALGALSAGASGSITFAVTVANPVPAGVTQLSNTASIADNGANGADPTPANNTASDTTPITAQPDLRVTKVGPASAAPGSTLSYILSYSNAGNQTATSVTLTETVPANTTFNPGASTAGWTCLPNNNAESTCTLNIGTVAGAGASGSVTFAVTVVNPVAAAVDYINNTVSIADDGANGSDPNPGDNTAAATTPLNAAPDLSVTKTGPVSTTPGATVAYTLTYANNGNQGATGVRLNEIVPANTTFHAGASTAGWSCTPNNNAGSVCTLIIGSLPAGGAAQTASFAVTVNNPLPSDVSQINNSADISDDEKNGVDSNPANNTGSAGTTVNAAPDLHVIKTGPASAAPGGAISYTVAYQNLGNQDATGVTLSETVPANTTFNPAVSTAGWTCAPNNNAGSTCTYTVGALASGATGQATYAVQLPATAPAGLENVINTATITDDGNNGADPNLGNNRSTATTPVTAAPDLSVSKSDGDFVAKPGDTVSYTLSYANLGTQDAANVALTETVPVNTTFSAAASTAGWACAPDGNAGSTCTLGLGTLASGGSGTAVFAVTISNPVPTGATTISNMVVIDDDGTSGPDLNPVNNTGSDTTPLLISTGAPDLSMSKDDGGASAAPGETIAYTLTFENLSTVGATDVTLNETVPANTIFNPAASTAGWTCVPNNNAGSSCTLNVGSLAAGASGSVTFAITVNNPLPAGVTQASNTAAISDDGSNGQDSNPNNNAGSDTTPLIAAPDLSVTKSGPASVVPGGTTAYTLTYANTGSQGATGVILSEMVPANTTFNAGASTAGWICAPNNNAGSTCTFNIGAVAGGAGGTATFAVTLASPLAAGIDLISNTATIADDGSNGADPTPGNNTGSATTPVDAAPDLRLTKSDGGASTVPGGVAAYTLSYQNSGSQEATGVVITETVPANTVFNSAASTSGWACAPDNNAGSTCTINIGSVSVGSGGTLTFAVTVNNPIAASVTQVSNTAIIGDDGVNGTDPTPENNTATDRTPVSVTASLSLDKQASPATYAAVGDVINYSYLVTNTGNVTIWSPFTVSDNLLTVTCPGTPSSLTPGANLTCNASYTITQADLDAGSITNTASASGQLLGTPVTSPTDSATVTALQNPSILLEKTANPTTYNAANQVITYTYTITNNGNVTVTGPFSVTDDHVTVNCTGAAASLPPTQQTTCTATYTITQANLDANATITNIATAQTANNGHPLITPPASATVTPVQAPGMTLTKTYNGYTDADGSGNFTAGDLLRYTLVARNTGNQTLTSVSISDPLLDALTCTPAQPTSLAPTAALTCTGAYALQQSDLDSNGGGDGSIENIAAASSAQTPSQTASVSVPLALQPGLGVSKRVVSQSEVSTGTYDITFTIEVENYGNTALAQLQVTDNLNTAFPAPTTFTVRSLAGSTGLTVNSAYNGSSDTNLLVGGDTLTVGGSGELTLVVRVVPASSGSFLNAATGSGTPPAGNPVVDISQNGPDPDPDGDGDPTNNSDPTPISFGPKLFDPPMGIKQVDSSGQPMLRWTVVWINNSNIAALNAAASDPLPMGLTYIAGGSTSGYPVPSGAPAGSTNVGVTCTDTSTATITTLCYYEAPTTAYPRGRVIWQGTLGPDFGVTDPAVAQNEITITFSTTVKDGVEDVRNTATIDADLNGNGDSNDSGEQQVASARAVWHQATSIGLPGRLPATGFAPGVATDLSGVPAAEYSAAGDLNIAIPSLKLDLPVVGVPLKDGDWNVTWLWQQAGWLEGTAFPTWQGNSVVTGHVYLPNGKPGPFVNLKNLAWGDKIIVHAFGQDYIYQVREVKEVKPGDTSVLGHEDKAWLTLLTCKDYDEKTKTYHNRLVVRAVLVEVK